MFTGIIQGLAEVAAVELTARARPGGTPAHRLELQLGPLADGLDVGASVAINGVCLTLAERRGRVSVFEVVPETWERTNLADLRPGDQVHVERSLRAGDALDGHFVQGHVDGVGVVERVDRRGGECKLWVRAEPELMRFIVSKGSVALDGTSLTVVDVSENRFSVALVPTTLQRTTLGRRKPGGRINIETDILARLVISRLAELMGAAPGPEAATGLTWDKLRTGGFVT